MTPSLSGASGGGVSQILPGSGVSVSPSGGEGVVTVSATQLVQTRTVTVPSAWVLANGVASEGVSFEVIPGVVDKSIVLFGAVATLRFNTAAYTGSTSDTDLSLFYGSDPFTAALVNDSIPQGFWDATSDASSPILPLPSSTQPNVLGLPISFYLNGQGLADGDSDVDITVFYALA